jgi:hypothetical protein
MSSPTIYVRHALTIVEEGDYQTFGDLVFYPNGAVRLGGTTFAYRTSIHRYQFGAALTALRVVDRPNELEVITPQGSTLKFLYRPFFRRWYQVVEIHDPWIYLQQERFGTLVAISIYYLRCGTKWLLVEVVRLLCLMAFVVVVCLLAKYL